MEVSRNVAGVFRPQVIGWMVIAREREMREVNEGLAAWLSECHGMYRYSVVWDTGHRCLAVRKVRPRVEATHFVQGLFTECLNSVAMVEARLSAQQRWEYGALVLRGLGGLPENCGDAAALLLIDAPTRAQALFQVLCAAPA